MTKRHPPGVSEVHEPVSLYDAKTNLSELVDLASEGAEIIIMKSGKPMARLAPLARRHAPRVPGRGRGLWSAKASFDQPLPEKVLELFEPGS